MLATLLSATLIGLDGRVIQVEVDRYESVPSYDAWWEVPVAATSEAAGVRDARKGYEKAKQKQRRYL